MKTFKINKKLAIIGIIISLLLAFIPDPTDLIDAGTPIAEIISVLVFYFLGIKK